MESYKVWTSHIEVLQKRKKRKSCETRECRRVVDDHVDINSMLHDFAGSNHEFYDTTGTTNV